MRGFVIVAMFLLCGCTTSRHSVTTHFVRVDSLTAGISDNLKVTLTDVIICPVDSSQPKVKVAKIELQQQRDAIIQQTSRAETDSIVSVCREPAASTVRKSSKAAIIVGIAISTLLVLIIRKIRSK